jgi:hypothetical protein
LSCSHETFFIGGESWAKSHRYPMRAYRNTFVAGRCRPHSVRVGSLAPAR